MRVETTECESKRQNASRNDKTRVETTKRELKQQTRVETTKRESKQQTRVETTKRESKGQNASRNDKT